MVVKIQSPILQLATVFFAMRYAPCALLFTRKAEVAELVDALDSGSSGK